MSIQAAKRMASRILKAGESRIWFDPEHLEDIDKAITKDDVRILVRKRYIKAEKIKGVPRTRGKMHADRKRKGRASGFGKRKGTFEARVYRKGVWMARVRSQRKLLRELKDQGMIITGYRETYQKIKGGEIKDKSHLRIFLKERGFIKEKSEKKK